MNEMQKQKTGFKRPYKCLLIVVMVSWLYTYVKTYQIAHIKYVQYVNYTSIKVLKFFKFKNALTKIKSQTTSWEQIFANCIW